MASPSHQLLLSETRERITQLEEAIAQINAVRKGLKENAIEVKSQISTVFGRQLECLRSRELWLQGQVELVEQAKEAVLRRQQDRLCRLLGGLSTSLAYSQEEEGGVKLDKKLSESIEKLDAVDLKPEESSHISFRADTTGLRQSIRMFGRVDAKGLPLENAFVGQETTSTCLPRSYEDYGEPEHLVLYKTVEEIGRKNGHEVNVDVNVPRLSSEPKRPWLSYSISTSSLDKITPANKGPTFQRPTATGGRYSLTSEHSIQDWLHQIKGHVETEDDDFELISSPRTHTVSTSSDSIEMLSLPGGRKVSNAPDFSYFSQIKGSPLQDWIRKRPAETGISDAASSTTLDDWSDWLASKPSTGCCQGACATTPSSVDIENLDQLACAQESNYWSAANSGKRWLSTSKKLADTEEKDVDEAEAMLAVCRANEPCGDLSECVSDEKCCVSREKPSLTPAVKDWLLKPKSPAVMEDLQASPFLSYFRALPVLDSTWLSRQPATTTADPCCDLFPVFQQETSRESWLATASTCPVSQQRDVMAPMVAPYDNSIVSWLNASKQKPDDLRYDLYPVFNQTTAANAWLLPSSHLKPASGPPACIESTLKHMQDISQGTSLQWLPGHRPTTTPTHTTEQPCWLKPAATPAAAAEVNSVVNAVMEGLNKQQQTWKKQSEPNKNQCSPTKQSTKPDDKLQWLLSSVKTSSKAEISGPAKSPDKTGKSSWLQHCEAEEDDSQWLLRKESAPSSPSHGCDLEKLSQLFPCFQTKEELGTWLMGHNSVNSDL